MHLIAAELSENENDMKELLDYKTVVRVCRIEKTTPDALKQMIYKTFQDFGYEHAKGVFEMLFLQQ